MRARTRSRSRAAARVQSLQWAHRALWFDVGLYVAFLTVFLLVALAPFTKVAWDGHQLINVFTRYAARLEWPDPSSTFVDAHSAADFWSWWRGPFRCAAATHDQSACPV